MCSWSSFDKSIASWEIHHTFSLFIDNGIYCDMLETQLFQFFNILFDLYLTRLNLNDILNIFFKSVLGQRQGKIIHINFIHSKQLHITVIYTQYT